VLGGSALVLHARGIRSVASHNHAEAQLQEAYVREQQQAMNAYANACLLGSSCLMQ
jgi:hypothetical protein